MTGQPESDYLNGDENDDGRNHDHQIPLVAEEVSEGVETAVDEKSVVGVDDAVGDADARRPPEVDERVDRHAFVSVEKGGVVRGIDDDVRRRRNAAARRHVAERPIVVAVVVAIDGGSVVAVLTDVGLQLELPLLPEPSTRLPRVERRAAIGRHAAAPERLLQPIPRVLEGGRGVRRRFLNVAVLFVESRDCDYDSSSFTYC